MIEEGLFSHFLKPLLQKKNEKDVLKKILDEYIKSSEIVDQNKYLIELKEYKYKNSLFFLAYAKFNEITRKRLFDIKGIYGGDQWLNKHLP